MWIRKLFSALIACLFFLPVHAQYYSDTAYRWNGASYTVFKVVVDSFTLKGLSLVENTKRSPEDTIFPVKASMDLFAVTGCIVDPSCKPLGLYVAGGKLKKKLNLGSGAGNFFELTNGVLAFTERHATIKSSRAFKLDSAQKWALQTGPMLIDSASINTQLKKESTNRQIRVGVGISDTLGIQTLIFVRSNEPVNFHHLASLFLDLYKCKTALCLESGSFSSIRIPGVSKTVRHTEGSCIYISLRL
jgi:uncharacterized protein YigE (DUF2233 family)